MGGWVCGCVCGCVGVYVCISLVTITTLGTPSVAFIHNVIVLQNNT